jgi:hypothetical protein
MEKQRVVDWVYHESDDVTGDHIPKRWDDDLFTPIGPGVHLDSKVWIN